MQIGAVRARGDFCGRLQPDPDDGDGIAHGCVERSREIAEHAFQGHGIDLLRAVDHDLDVEAVIDQQNGLRRIRTAATATQLFCVGEPGNRAAAQ